MEELNRKQKKSHDHRFTTWLKNIIFGIVMIAPFLSVMARTIYVQSNPNAMESYYGETINQELYQSISYNNLIEDNVYYFNNNILTNTYEATPQTTMWISNINLITPLNIDLSNATNMKFYVNSTGIPRLYFYNGDNAIGSPIDLNNSSINFSFKFLGSTNISSNTTLLNDVNFSYITYNNYSYLDNAFEYSINQLHNVNVYNWSKNTAIYTAIDNMTSGLGMGTNNTLALLLAYWSILTAVYIVFDIIIFCFTKITHFINSD